MFPVKTALVRHLSAISLLVFTRGQLQAEATRTYIVKREAAIGVIDIGGAVVTQQSAIYFIALAGIIMRNSILLVDFAIQEIHNDQDVHEAVMLSCKAGARPIIITALALLGDASVSQTDPIFQGMVG